MKSSLAFSHDLQKRLCLQQPQILGLASFARNLANHCCHHNLSSAQLVIKFTINKVDILLTLTVLELFFTAQVPYTSREL
jgi:hypothetical protein